MFALVGADCVTSVLHSALGTLCTLTEVWYCRPHVGAVARTAALLFVCGCRNLRSSGCPLICRVTAAAAALCAPGGRCHCAGDTILPGDNPDSPSPLQGSLPQAGVGVGVGVLSLLLCPFLSHSPCSVPWSGVKFPAEPCAGWQLSVMSQQSGEPRNSGTQRFPCYLDNKKRYFVFFPPK